LANFPVGIHDDIVDAFCHAMKAFTTARDFKTRDLAVMPGRLLTGREAEELAVQEQSEWQSSVSINPELDKLGW
jgi:hypothetical protein